MSGMLEEIDQELSETDNLETTRGLGPTGKIHDVKRNSRGQLRTGCGVGDDIAFVNVGFAKRRGSKECNHVGCFGSTEPNDSVKVTFRAPAALVDKIENSFGHRRFTNRTGAILYALRQEFGGEDVDV